MNIEIKRNISNTKKSVSSEYPNTKKFVENRGEAEVLSKLRSVWIFWWNTIPSFWYSISNISIWRENRGECWLNLCNTMIASDSFVLRGTSYSPHCSCKREMFPCIWYAIGKFSGRQRISLSTNFPSLTCTGKLVEILCFPLNSKFPVGKILKVFLGDHSITKWQHDFSGN